MGKNTAFKVYFSPLSGKEKDLLESINDKVTVDISEIANVLEGKVNLAIKTIAEDNTVTIQDKNNQIPLTR